MEAKIEIINGHKVIRTEHWSLTEDNNLLRTSAHFKLDGTDLDELYAVLHAREVAKQWHKAEEYLHGVVELAEKNGIEVK